MGLQLRDVGQPRPGPARARAAPGPGPGQGQGLAQARPSPGPWPGPGPGPRARVRASQGEGRVQGRQAGKPESHTGQARPPGLPGRSHVFASTPPRQHAKLYCHSHSNLTGRGSSHKTQADVYCKYNALQPLSRELKQDTELTLRSV